MSHAAQRTAFVFAGGGSLGAVQVGMLRELMHAGVSADLRQRRDGRHERKIVRQLEQVGNRQAKATLR